MPKKNEKIEEVKDNTEEIIEEISKQEKSQKTSNQKPKKKEIIPKENQEGNLELPSISGEVKESKPKTTKKTQNKKIDEKQPSVDKTDSKEIEKPEEKKKASPKKKTLDDKKDISSKILPETLTQDVGAIVPPIVPPETAIKKEPAKKKNNSSSSKKETGKESETKDKKEPSKSSTTTKKTEKTEIKPEPTEKKTTKKGSSPSKKIDTSSDESQKTSNIGKTEEVIVEAAPALDTTTKKKTSKSKTTKPKVIKEETIPEKAPSEEKEVITLDDLGKIVTKLQKNTKKEKTIPEIVDIQTETNSDIVTDKIETELVQEETIVHDDSYRPIEQEEVSVQSIDLLAVIRKQLAEKKIEEPSLVLPVTISSKTSSIDLKKTPKKHRSVVRRFLPFAAVLVIALLTTLFILTTPTKVESKDDEELKIIDVIEVEIKEEEPPLPPPIPDEILSISINRKETYLPFEGQQLMEAIIEYTGEVDETVIWSSSDSEVADITDEGLVTGHSNGTVTITATASNGMTGMTEVVVTDCIILPSYEYKAFIPSHYYTPEEAELMDRILTSRVNDAGGPGTRGAVVAAARFITLEMPYMIPYFYENGRMNPNVGRPTCDGEGRYYHVGLYLSDAKFDTIEISVAGPAIWGAPLTNYQDAGYFTRGLKYPNGLDCSGYVSWAMLNGGIDTGDIGAGNYYGVDKEFYDIGEHLPLSPEILLSGEIKPGDLIGIDGHIAIICGLDDTNIWISESYYRGVNTVCFTINRGIMDCKEYDFLIKMDHMYYAGQGTYTDTWVKKDVEEN